MSARLHAMCRRKGLALRLVAEVGVYYPETSNVLEFIRDGVPAMLVEADPQCVARIHDFFRAEGGRVRVMPYAVWDTNGRIALYRTNSSTFAEGVSGSPATVNDAYVPSEGDRFEVEARKFSELDDGGIDLLSIDIEGAEWYVLKHLRSRPQVITLETHAGEYRNPNIASIEQWMRENGYDVWFIDHTDTVYVRRGAIETSAVERSMLRFTNALKLGRQRLKAYRRAARRAVFGGRRKG